MHKSLILNGSPRPHGETQKMIDLYKAQMGGEVTVVDVYRAKFSPCTDCRYCWKVRGCVFKDDLEPVYEGLDIVDFVVLASPIYFSELTGPLLSYVSRFQRYYAERYLMKDRPFKMKQKKGLILLAAGGSTKEFEKPIETASMILRHINAEPIGTVVAESTDTLGVDADRRVKIAMAEVITQLKASYMELS